MKDAPTEFVGAPRASDKGAASCAPAVHLPSGADAHLCRLPDADLTRLGHQEQTEQERDGRHGDGIDQRVARLWDMVSPAVCAVTYAAVVMTGTSPPPQPLPM